MTKSQSQWLNNWKWSLMLDSWPNWASDWSEAKGIQGLLGCVSQLTLRVTTRGWCECLPHFCGRPSEDHHRGVVTCVQFQCWLNEYIDGWPHSIFELQLWDTFWLLGFQMLPQVFHSSSKTRSDVLAGQFQSQSWITRCHLCASVILRTRFFFSPYSNLRKCPAPTLRVLPRLHCAMAPLRHGSRWVQNTCNSSGIADHLQNLNGSLAAHKGPLWGMKID